MHVSPSRTWISSLIVPFTASVALDSIPFDVVVASEGDSLASPATIPERNIRYASLLIFMLMMVVTVKWLLSLVFDSYLNGSRDAESASGSNRSEREGSSGRVLANGGSLSDCYRAD
jgi:hypothetical protein